MNKRFVAAGLGLALAAGLAVAGPVSSAFAADRPNTLADARKAAPTELNVWVNNETIGSAKDQDWYHYELTRSARVMVTLGALPADYQLALYGSDGKVVATSARPGQEFERITKKLSAGSYFVKVWSAKGSSKKPYRLRFRELPADQVFVLDQTVRFDDLQGRHARLDAMLFNSTSSWQVLDHYVIRTENDRGQRLGDDIWIWSGSHKADYTRIPPGGSVPIEWGRSQVPKGATRFVVTPYASAIGAPASLGVTVKRDPSRPIVRNSKRGDTEYPVVLTNSSSKRRDVDIWVAYYSSIGNLTDLGDGWDSVGPHQTLRSSVTLNWTTKTPNLLRITLDRGV